MAQHQNQEDPVRQTEGYGKPIGHHGGATGGEYGTGGGGEYGTGGNETATTGAAKYSTGGEYGTGGYETATTGAAKYSTGGEYGTGGNETATTGAGKYGVGAPGSGTDIGGQYDKEQQGKLHRSGSSGSSSSEDDGQGGRRKKGTKKNLTGTGYADPSHANVTTPGGRYSAEQDHEKKGIMDKIKEKLPGRHDNQ